MKKYKLALVGFGNVGQGFAKVLLQNKAVLEKQGLAYQIVAVSDMKLGSIYSPKGFTPSALLEAAAKGDPDHPTGDTAWLDGRGDDRQFRRRRVGGS